MAVHCTARAGHHSSNPSAQTSRAITGIAPPGLPDGTVSEPAGPGSEQAPSTVTATWPANPSATCYSTPSLNDPNQFGVAFGFKDGESNVVILDNYVTACRESLTRQGWLPPGADVSTCLKKDDTVGIFPGDPAVCGQVGLPVAVAG